MAEPSYTQVALNMCASMEGLTIFAGHEKSWSTQLDTEKHISINNFVDMIKKSKG